VGLSSPLWLDARQTALVLRARKLTPEKTSFRDRRGFALGDVRARRLADSLVGRARLLELAAPALAEATRELEMQAPLPLFLSLPARRSEAEEPLGADFLEALGKRACVPLAPEACEPFPIGHAGFAAALERALSFLAASAAPAPAAQGLGLGRLGRAPESAPRARAPYAIVGGVDSYHDPAVLEALDKEHRVHAEGTWDGFIPSEAAAFVVVTLPNTQLPSVARVLGVATAMERPEDPQNPSIGEAATELARSVGTNLRAPVPWVLPDVNGERHRVKEWSFVRIRNREIFDESATIETRLCDELGDVGAASGALHAAYICWALRLGFAPAQQALVTLASEGQARGAFALGAP